MFVPPGLEQYCPSASYGTFRPPPGLSPAGSAVGHGATPGVSLELRGEGDMGSMEDLRNWGSVGHPEACSRPCVYIHKSGDCRYGSLCPYCHLPHGAPNKPDKKQRMYISQMTSQERLRIVLPIVRQRAMALGLLPAAEDLLLAMEAELTEETVTPSISSKQLRELIRLMRRMSFSQLVQLAMSPFSSADEALVRLRARLAPNFMSRPIHL
mmetsp:Transcript_8426/g.19412  ORF Transcript_8426/g.19412 Transcript_8426/m.19412 type:complete len:211 (+) Transcript_8426:21-653(+)